MGPNTPIVTRIPASAFASAVAANGGNVTYLRVNPDPPEPPNQNPVGGEGLNFIRWREPWAALEPLLDEAKTIRATAPTASERVEGTKSEGAATKISSEAAQFQQSYKRILLSLRTPR